jgi:hypothetical protein
MMVLILTSSWVHSAFMRGGPQERSVKVGETNDVALIG